MICETFSTICDKKSTTVSELRTALDKLDGRAIIGVSLKGHIQYVSIVDVAQDTYCSVVRLELRGQVT